ncbi:MAG TPA: DNA ligase D [Anaeromyxobacteraceae bacterium]|nr:DNA ligase D [Anaeromyxobacteraceae bacterium]
MPKPDEDALSRYRSKRSPSQTPEPFGEVGESRGTLLPGALSRFVVQKHRARRLHYDFRLELAGVLKSWAVPKGPSANPADKRLAVHVEDHPLEYAGFEGLIPAGNYGAGSVIVWDRGAFEPLADALEGLARGKLLFRLYGHKLKGEWTLFRAGKGGEDWMLVKHRDAEADLEGRRTFDERSVLSGLLVEELADRSERASALEEEAARLGASRTIPGRAKVGFMLATPGERPFSAKGWLFEPKIDGYRALASKEGELVSLRYRGGREVSSAYPEVALTLRSLIAERALIDGELCVVDREGRPNFQALQGRAGLTRPADVERAELARPATYFAFDLLALGERDLTKLPLSARKSLLARLVPRLGSVRLLEAVEERGELLWEAVRSRGLEGLVAKRADAPYRAGRSPDWIKVRGERSGDFIVVGFTAPGGKGRVGLGSLTLAVCVGEDLVYAGSVGSGFKDRELTELENRLRGLTRATPPCRDAVFGRGQKWVEPSVVCEVTYHAWTEEGRLRQPVFVRVRDDKRPSECGSEGRPLLKAAWATPPEDAEDDGKRSVAVTNEDKLYFPEDGFTKGDLVAYYRTIAPFILPWLKGRPLTLTRFPDGIHGKSFFQKDAPAWRPAFIHTARIRSEEGGRELTQYVVDDLESLLHVVNLGAIPLHVGAARLPHLDRPDFCSLDLDPKGAPFSHVVQIARAIRALCESIGLPFFVKTTGQAGLHVLLPLGGQLDHPKARAFAGLLARAVVEEAPQLSTLERTVAARGGRVYVDTLQNGEGKTLAAPFCVRPRPGAPVSTPLRPAELSSRLDPSRFTIRTVPRRMERLGDDPMSPLLHLKPDLVSALSRLRERWPLASSPA